jgi:hypothetical protein
VIEQLALESFHLLNCSNAEAWVDINGKAVCTSPTLLESSLDSLTQSDVSSDVLYAFDHVFPYSGTLPSGAPRVILYATAGTTSMAAFHSTLKPLAEAGKVCMRCSILYCGGMLAVRF